jgi:hypothetical protein
VFTPSATELTTAATDAAMALLCAVLLARLAGDHNGLFHLVQMIATVVIAIGVRQQLGHV